MCSIYMLLHLVQLGLAWKTCGKKRFNGWDWKINISPLPFSIVAPSIATLLINHSVTSHRPHLLSSPISLSPSHTTIEVYLVGVFNWFLLFFFLQKDNHLISLIRTSWIHSGNTIDSFLLVFIFFYQTIKNKGIVSENLFVSDWPIQNPVIESWVNSSN